MKLLYVCQSPTCDSEDQARRHVDQVPLVFPTHDGFGRTRDASAEYWTFLNAGDRSIRSVKKGQTSRRKRGGMRFNNWGFAGLNKHCVGSTSKPQEN